MGNFCDKSTEATLHEICVQVFLRFSNSSKPSQSVSLIYECAWLAGFHKSEETCSKRHERLFLRPKLSTYFDDITTIENNRQVRVDVDATLVAIFRIRGWLVFGLSVYCKKLILAVTFEPFRMHTNSNLVTFILQNVKIAFFVTGGYECFTNLYYIWLDVKQNFVSHSWRIFNLPDTPWSNIDSIISVLCSCDRSIH